MEHIIFLSIASGMTVLCLSLQAAVGVYATRIFRICKSKADMAHPKFSAFWAIAFVMLVLMLGNILQIIVWAYLYMALGEFETFNIAFYFSGVTFTSLGYGDVVLSESYRALAPVEAANGLMMFGVSVALLLAVIQKNESHTSAKWSKSE